MDQDHTVSADETAKFSIACKAAGPWLTVIVLLQAEVHGAAAALLQQEQQVPAVDLLHKLQAAVKLQGGSGTAQAAAPGATATRLHVRASKSGASGLPTICDTGDWRHDVGAASDAMHSRSARQVAPPDIGRPSEGQSAGARTARQRAPSNSCCERNRRIRFEQLAEL